MGKWLLGGGYKPSTDEWTFQFSRGSGLLEALATMFRGYDLIFDEVKERCEFFGIVKFKDEDYACYSCPESSYKGKIGFRVDEDSGIIRHFTKY